MTANSRVKPKGAVIVSESARPDWRVKVAKLLETLQEVYRQEISEGESRIWLEDLRPYSFAEIQTAATDLRRHPPLQQLESGETQPWRGMPQVNDLVQRIEGMRQEKQQEMARERQRERDREMAELHTRRENHPEEFFGWADVMEDLKREKPELYDMHFGALQTIGREITGPQERKRPGMTNEMTLVVRGPLTDEQLDRRREELRRQAAEVMKKLESEERQG